METPVKSTIYFGEFALDPLHRVLEKDGETVHVNSKALDLLLVLIENRGEIVEKNELLDKVWADQFVEENNLTVHVAALRKALGDKKGNHRHIVTVPGRGYSFVAVVKAEEEKEAVGSGSRQSAEIESANYEDQRPKIKDQIPKTLVGRTREISEIENLLRGDENRLITLTGAGGSGKTSLARTVGNDLKADFADGVFFIELAALNNPELVASAIAKTLGVDESGSKSLTESLIDFLSKRRTLLILDNFEQILDAAPLLQKILDSTAFLKILVTSRAVLRLDYEREIVVTPLALPPLENNFSAEKLSGYAAIELFIRRAKSARQNFVLSNENASDISEICRKLDGLPLAIELAAARVKLLSPESILERLKNSLNLLTSGAKNLPERQRTMRGAVQWSYELLDENEQILFRRLAVFAGGFTVEAAEAICEKDAESKFSVLDILTNLIENSLLVQIEKNDGNVRLRMFEVVREFALEMLEKSGELENLRQLHTQYFLALAEKAEPFLMGETGNEWLEKLENEHNNFRAVLIWSLKNDETAAARIAAALRFFWLNHSHLSEGFRWSKAALEKTENSFSEARSKLLLSNGLFLRQQGKSEEAREVYEKTLSESKELNDLSQIIKANHGLAAIAVLHKDFATAQSFIEEALTLSRNIKDEMQTAFSLCSLGDLEMSKKNSSAARPLLEECLAISKKLTNNRLLTTTYFNLGTIDYLENRYESAAFNFTESMQIAQKMGNKTMISCALDGFAALAATTENAVQSAELAGAAEGLREFIGYNNEPAEEIFREEYLAKTRSILDRKLFVAAYEKGKNLELTEAVALAESSIPEIYQQDTEIIIETHKFERIFIDEEIEEYENEPKLINEISVSSNKKTSRSWLEKHLAVIITAILLLAAIGGAVYFWQNGRLNFASEIPFAKSNIKQLTTNGSVELAALSPDGKVFAYTTKGAGQKSLWLGYVDGGNHLELRPAADVKYFDLNFSPDGTRLYFSVKDDKNPNGTLYKMPVSGGAAEKVLDNISNFVLAPDGWRIIFGKRDKESETVSLFITDLSNAEQRKIASFPQTDAVDLDTISWSPDGGRIAVSLGDIDITTRQILHIIEIATGKIEKIPNENLREISKTVWLAGGKGLIVSAIKGDSWSSVPQQRIIHVELPSGKVRELTSDRSSYGLSLDLSANSESLLTIEHRQMNNIWIAPSDDLSQARQITFGSFGKYDGLWGLDWTPDGKIIYVNSDTESQFISQMNSDGGESKPLTAAGAIDSALNVSPDGRFIVFHSSRGGGFDIWRMDADGGNPTQLTFGKKNFMPFVSADNRRVYYKSLLGKKAELRRVSIDGGEPEILNDNETSWLSFSPDGRYFATSYITDKQRLAIFSAETNEVLQQFDLPKNSTMSIGLRWMPDSKAVAFRDWNDGYWIQPINGGEPQKLIGLPEEKLYNFAWSKDGKWFAFVRGQEIRDVVLFQNK